MWCVCLMYNTLYTCLYEYIYPCFVSLYVSVNVCTLYIHSVVSVYLCVHLRCLIKLINRDNLTLKVHFFMSLK